MVRSLDFILQLVGNHWTVFSKAFFLLEPAKLIPGQFLSVYSYIFPLTIELCMASYFLSFQVSGQSHSH